MPWTTSSVWQFGAGSASAMALDLGLDLGAKDTLWHGQNLWHRRARAWKVWKTTGSSDYHVELQYHFLKLLVVAQTNHIIHQMVSVLHMASLVFLEIHSDSAEQRSRREKHRKFIELFTKVFIILPNIPNIQPFTSWRTELELLRWALAALQWRPQADLLWFVKFYLKIAVAWLLLFPKWSNPWQQNSSSLWLQLLSKTRANLGWTSLNKCNVQCILCSHGFWQV